MRGSWIWRCSSTRVCCPAPTCKSARRWSVMPLLEEDLFFISAKKNTRAKMAATLKLSQLKNEPTHSAHRPAWPAKHFGGRRLPAARFKPDVVLEIDSSAMSHGGGGRRLGGHPAALGRQWPGFPMRPRAFTWPAFRMPTCNASMCCAASQRTSCPLWHWRLAWCSRIARSSSSREALADGRQGQILVQA
jgi:hypothetical protein